jgi:two-component system, cell cycle sensor histidine kinase and response regulator CckA
MEKSTRPRHDDSEPIRASLQVIERRQWWLSSFGIIVTLILTLGIVVVMLPALLPELDPTYSLDTKMGIHALVGLVFLFDLYVIFQQLQIHRIRLQLAEREELFRIISENAADMIALVDVSGHRLYNSPSYQKVLGYSPEELEKTSSYEQIHPEDQPKVLEAAREAKQTGLGRRLEYRIRHKEGRWLIFESTASVVRDAAGEVQKMVIVNRDITERKQLEEKLYLSQKLDAVGRLSGGIAHDFNNLLGVIIGYGEVLERRIPADDSLREAVDEIMKAGNRAAGLTQQLLAFSRKQVLEPKVLDLNTVVVEVQRMLERLIGEDIELVKSLAPKLGKMKADRTQIEQVILNLAVNARDAMPQGGTLTFETENASLDDNSVHHMHHVTPGNYVLLKVTDTGCGMDAELQSHIFEPFYTTKGKGKGTGLGLATVYGVVKQSGGYIWVESEIGKGTTFKIYLPRVEESVEKIQEIKGPVRLAEGSRTVLLVEDEQSLRKLARKMLNEIGCTVLEANDPAHALEIARQTKTAIDLLLTDVVMPGMSGRAVAEKLCPTRPEMRVLYMSGYTDGAIAPHGVLEPGISILRKPFTRDELARRLDEVLAGVTRP